MSKILPRLIPCLLLILIIAACRLAAEDGTPAALPPPEVTTTTPAPGYPAVVTTGNPYPPPAATTTPAPIAAYPDPATPMPSRNPAAVRVTVVPQEYLPLVLGPEATPTPPATPTPSPSPTPTIDFRAVRAQLNAAGQELGFVKLGFHVGPGGNTNGLGTWMQRLDAAGVPFMLKSVDTAGPLVEAQQLRAASGVPHVLVYRTSGQEFDVPDYALLPEQAARQHWERHKATFPAELDRDVVWFETMNEVDAKRSVWLAEFALATARLALAEGYRWAAFGWSSGEPEPIDWQQPAMLEFLRLAAANPDRLAVSLHEYSYTTTNIADQYPFKVGRFQELFRACDQQGIPRPTVLITEWGWEYQNIPPAGQALADIAWAARLYAPYPEIKGAAIWYLGPGFADIADQTQRLIAPLTEYALGNYFAIPLPPEQAEIDPDRYRP